MNLRPGFLFGLNVALVALAVACAPTDDSSASSDDALSGSLASARTCAVENAYAAASLAAFVPVTKADLPAGIPAEDATALAKLDVKDLGTVFIIETKDGIQAYDAGGARLGRATVNGSTLTWYQPNETPASCNGASSSSSSGSTSSSSSSSGGAVATTCLSTAPIDATQYEYQSPVAAAAGKCTDAEAQGLATYYQAHSTEAAFSIATWKASTSAACGECAFGTAGNAQWAPIMEGPDGSLKVNRGGCIEQVSQNAACGRAYEQFNSCLLDACLASCSTQEEFSKCRQDASVLTTSCKAATDQLYTACGQANIGGYETKCKGTSYTFEGPVRVACVTGQ